MKKVVVDRMTAQSKGLKRYYTGEPCKKGHIAERFVSSGGCVLCVNWATRGASGPNVKGATLMFPALGVSQVEMAQAVQMTELLAQNTLFLMAQHPKFKRYVEAGWTIPQMWKAQVVHKLAYDALGHVLGYPVHDDRLPPPPPPEGFAPPTVAPAPPVPGVVSLPAVQEIPSARPFATVKV